jgi:hypothetical protein
MLIHPWDAALEKPTVPSTLEEPEMTVEGYVLQPIKFGRSDVDHSSALYVPELDALIAGDMIYNDIHFWMVQSNHEQRIAWIETLDEIERLHPNKIIAGHIDPDAWDNDGSRILDQTRRYIHDFDEAVIECGSGQDVVSTMTDKYPSSGTCTPCGLALSASPTGSSRNCSGVVAGFKSSYLCGHDVGSAPSRRMTVRAPRPLMETKADSSGRRRIGRDGIAITNRARAVHSYPQCVAGDD